MFLEYSNPDFQFMGKQDTYNSWTIYDGFTRPKEN